MDTFNYALPVRLHDEPSPLQKELGAVCEQFGGETIEADSFYRAIFPPETIEYYHKGLPEKPGHKGNPLILIQRGAWMYKNSKPNWAHGINVEDVLGEYHTRQTKRILFNDYLWVNDWRNLEDVKHVWASGLTYIGKTRSLPNAVAMHALIFDLDYMTPEGLKNFLGAMDSDIYPRPNYIVLSGTGIHVYYVFQDPMPLYHGSYGRRVKGQLNKLKMALTRLLWNPYTVGKTYGDKPQYQGINQAFRLAGSYTKSFLNVGEQCYDRFKVIAYKFPNVKLYDTFEGFYRYVDFAEIPEEDHYKETAVFGLDYWKEKNPEWYERRIIQKDRSVKYWTMSRSLYDWWLKQVRTKAEFGHRYNCLFCCVVYAVKCGIPKQKVKADMIELLPGLSGFKPGDTITLNDVEEALATYGEELNTYPVKSIQYLSGIDIRTERSRRNGRTQQDHLKRARAVQTIDDPSGEWRNKNGAPTKEAIVKEWRKAHPDGKKAQCIRDTGLSKPTVLKWWEGVEK